MRPHTDVWYALRPRPALRVIAVRTVRWLAGNRKVIPPSPRRPETRDHRKRVRDD